MIATNLGAWTAVETALGTVHIAVLGDAVVRTGLPGTKAPEFLAGLQEAFPGTLFAQDDGNPTLARAARELQEYALGQRTTFSVRALPRGTGFQVKVWQALSNIPYGEVRTYGDVARGH
jgi:methylated-DNA-[protein]-cysteine S-methyltransferase